MRNKNWFIGVCVPGVIRHLIMRYVKKQKREVEQKKDRRPNVDTATSP